MRMGKSGFFFYASKLRQTITPVWRWKATDILFEWAKVWVQLPTILECVSLRKSKKGFLYLNPKEFENGFCVCLLHRSILPLSDHLASKEPKNPLWIALGVDSSVPLKRHYPKDLALICLVKKRKIHARILSSLRIQSWIFLKKRYKPINLYTIQEPRRGRAGGALAPSPPPTFLQE